MKAFPLALQSSVGTSYDQTRTTVVGNSSQKTLTATQGGKQVVGSPLNSIADVITDAGVTPNQLHVTSNGRAFAFVAITAGAGTIVHYEFDLATGAWTYIGKLAYNVPNSPATTHTLRSVRVVGDTTTTGWQIFVDTVGTVTANGGLFMIGHGTSKVSKSDFVPVGFATLPAATAINQKAVYFLQETGGTNLLTASQGMAVDQANTKIYVGNNTAATFQVYMFDWSLTISTVSAGGITSDLFVSKTGTLAGVAATILLLNNFTLCTPDATSSVPAGLQGQICLSIPCSTGFNIGKVSELTTGVTTWPSLAFCNSSDALSVNIAVTPLTSHFSQTLQRFISQFAAGKWLIKPFANGLWDLVFGSSNNTQARTGSPFMDFLEFGGAGVTSTFTQSGWIFIVHSGAGQIAITAFDLRSLYQYDYSAIISKVIDIPAGQPMSFSVVTPVRSFGRFFYRTSGFGSASGGWIAMPTDRDLSAVSFGTATQVQFKIQSRMERDGSTIPLQVIEAHLLHQPNNELSENWVGSVNDTDTGSPSRSGFKLVKAYTSSVPKLYFRAYDDSGNLVALANTVDNPTLFQYSSNSGVSWSALGTIPNTITTTRLRYNWASPPGVEVTVSLRES